MCSEGGGAQWAHLYPEKIWKMIKWYRMRCGIDRREPAWLWSTSCSASFDASAKYLVPSGADRITKSSESGYRKGWWLRHEGYHDMPWPLNLSKITAEYQSSSAALVLFVSALNNPDTPRILEMHHSRICLADHNRTAFQVYSARLEGNMLKGMDRHGV